MYITPSAVTNTPCGTHDLTPTSHTHFTFPKHYLLNYTHALHLQTFHTYYTTLHTNTTNASGATGSVTTQKPTTY
jgi:hypothetical protein